jgi:hypothetical protein
LTDLQVLKDIRTMPHSTLFKTAAGVAVAAASLLIHVDPVNAAEALPMVELRVGQDIYEGRIADKGRSWCVLFDRSGRMHTLNLGAVTKFKRVSSHFSPHSFQTLRTDLLGEFGKGYEVAASRHYLVCAPAGRASDYVSVFEETWRRFHMYFAVRGFEMDEPEFPLIAVILKDHESFSEYARNENAGIGSGILGYYWSTHNRVIMFEDPKMHATAEQRQLSQHRPVSSIFAGLGGSTPISREQLVLTTDPWDWAFSDPGDLAARSGINADLKETMIHEATHQLGYNTKLHNRTGRNPKWIVEGLATVFEAPGMEKARMGRSGKRANEGWLHGFRKFVTSTRPENFLETYIRDDRSFDSDISNAYAQAWALSFWLIETRPREYAGFLKKMANPEISKSLTAERRVKLFQEAFGSNLRMLDVEMLRWYERLAD